jgi:hypothetical protein
VDNFRPGLDVVARHIVAAGARDLELHEPISDPSPPLFDKHAYTKSKGLFESDNTVKKRYKDPREKIFKKWKTFLT